MSSSLHVLVTGGAGVIGRRVAGQLVERGHSVTILDRVGQLHPLVQNDPELRALASQVRWVEADVRDRNGVYSAIRKVNAVAHLASSASFVLYEREPINETSSTVLGFLTILEAARRWEVSRIVLASTSAVYEGTVPPYQESAVLRPPDLKSLSKKMAEQVADLYQDRHGITTVSLRPFSVYSDNETSKGSLANVISLFAWAMIGGATPVVWGDGHQTRDFVYVDDVARAFVLAVETQNLMTQAVNVGTGVETNYRDVIELIADCCGAPPEARYVEIPVDLYAKRLLADPTRAEQVLGFHPQVSVAAGVRRVVERARELLADSRYQHLRSAQELDAFARAYATRSI